MDANKIAILSLLTDTNRAGRDEKVTQENEKLRDNTNSQWEDACINGTACDFLNNMVIFGGK